MIAALALLKAFWPYVLGAVLIVGGYVYADQFWHNGVATRAEKKLTDLEVAAAKEQLRRAEAYTRNDQEQQVKAAKAEGKRNAEFAKLQERARDLPGVVGGVRIPGASVSLLNAGADLANAAGAPAAPESAAPAAAQDSDSTVQALTDWGIAVEKIHAACRERVQQWADWYAGVRSTK